MRERRKHDALLGEIVRNDLDDTTTILFDLSALTLLYEDGLISITPDEDVFSTEDLHGKPTTRVRIRTRCAKRPGLCQELVAGPIIPTCEVDCPTDGEGCTPLIQL